MTDKSCNGKAALKVKGASFQVKRQIKLIEISVGKAKQECKEKEGNIVAFTECRLPQECPQRGTDQRGHFRATFTR